MSQAACPEWQFITLRFQQFWDLRAEAEVGSEVGDEDPILQVLITGVGGTQPSECGQQRTLNSVHGHTAARLQCNGNLAV